MLSISNANRKWWILIAMGAVAGLIMLDETVVGVALPTLRRELGLSEVASHWVINAYMLVFAVLAAAAGKLGDVIGFRSLVSGGGIVFGLASLAAGFAEDGTVLIVARACQGAGGAVIFSCTVAMITVAFPPEQRGMALGILAAIGTGFLAAGPFIGGVLTELVSWRWIFWVNVPIVVLILVIASLAWVDPPRSETRPPFDYGGLVTLVAGLGLLVFAVMQGAAWGWTQGVILGSFAGGIVILGLFFVIERRCPTPLIDVELFRNNSFSVCTLVLFSGQFAKITMVVFVALYLQDRLAMSPLTAGLALLASVAAFPLLSTLVGRMADKLGANRLVLGGMALASVAMGWNALAGGWDTYLLLLPGLVLWGVGMSFCYAPTLRAMANFVPVDKQGQTSGIGITARSLGGTIGVAAGSTLLAATGSFQIVFLFAAILLATATGTWWLTIGRAESRPPGLADTGAATVSVSKNLS